MQWKCWPKELYGVARFDARELSPKARERLRALDLWRETGDIGLACRFSGMSRAGLYRWGRRFDPKNLRSLEDRSKRPRKVRKPNWPAELVLAVERLRKQQYPKWGKEKLEPLIKKEGFSASQSTVGRIIKELKRRKVLPEPKPWAISSRKRRTRRYATRKPRDYKAVNPGDLVELDTMDVRPLPGVVLKSFTSCDCISRWGVIESHRAATADNAAAFLESVVERTPFPIRAFQVDGGSEFKAKFEQACQNLGIPLFVLPPRSPKLNGHVERANRTHTEEFYELYQGPWTVAAIAPKLLAWEQTYNTIRPHHSLNKLTPFQFLLNHAIIPSRASPYSSHMC